MYNTKHWFSNFGKMAWYLWTVQHRHSGIDDAARWLWYLNVYRRDYGSRAIYADEIYTMKTAFIHYAVEHGHCKDISFQRQVSQCWECDGKGVVYDFDWSGDVVKSTCWKCGGSGEYSSIILVKFVFQFGDRYYTWHQPLWLVIDVDVVDEAWNAERENDRLPLYERDNDHTVCRMTAWRHAVLFNALWAWLALHGVHVRHPESESLVRSLLGDTGIYQLKYRLTRRIEDFSYFVGTRVRANDEGTLKWWHSFYR